MVSGGWDTPYGAGTGGHAGDGLEGASAGVELGLETGIQVELLRENGINPRIHFINHIGGHSLLELRLVHPPIQ